MKIDSSKEEDGLRSEHVSEHRTFQVLEASPARTRRVWSRAAKERIVAEASAPDANVSAIARAHGVRPQQVFRWRREAQSEAEVRRPALSFVELASTAAGAPVLSTAGASCEIVVADIVLRIGPDVTASRVVELIRAARQA